MTRLPQQPDEWREVARIWVAGIPVGQPRTRARAVRFGSKITARVYDPGTADSWKECVERACRPFCRSAPLSCDLKIDITVYFPRPKDHYGTGRNEGQLKASAPKYNSGKPDRDNLDKAILDAMTDIGLIRDDKQVVDGKAPVKRYVCAASDWKPGAEIVVSIPNTPIVAQLAGLADRIIAIADLPDCTGCTDPRSEGTHQCGTRQHP